MFIFFQCCKFLLHFTNLLNTLSKIEYEIVIEFSVTETRPPPTCSTGHAPKIRLKFISKRFTSNHQVDSTLYLTEATATLNQRIS